MYNNIIHNRVLRHQIFDIKTLMSFKLFLKFNYDFVYVAGENRIGMHSNERRPLLSGDNLNPVHISVVK